MADSPREIWLLRDTQRDDWVIAFDDPRGAENYLACFTQREAKAACEHQAETYDIDCEPVRVVPLPGQPMKPSTAASEIRRAVKALRGLAIVMPSEQWRGRMDEICDSILELLPGPKPSKQKTKTVKLRSPGGV